MRRAPAPASAPQTSGDAGRFAGALGHLAAFLRLRAFHRRHLRLGFAFARGIADALVDAVVHSFSDEHVHDLVDDAVQVHDLSP